MTEFDCCFGIIRCAIRRSRLIVQSIHQVAHAAGKATIAEFVENEAIIGRLSGIGIDYAQGFCVGLPEPLPQGIGETVAA